MTIAPTTTEQDFAARMEKLGVTQSFLAEYVGLSQSAISKAVNELTDSQRTKISDALLELEEISALFYPQKLWFQDAKATREWIDSPRLPRLFSVILAAQKNRAAGVAGSHQEAVMQYALEKLEECRRLEAEIASIQEKSRDEWSKFLEEINPSGR